MNKLLSNDLLIKDPSHYPYTKSGIEKVILDVTLSNKGNQSQEIYLFPLLHSLIYITGQYPLIKISTKSVASFKLRKGMEIGGLVTLKKSNMYHFLKQLGYIHLPQFATSSSGGETIKNNYKTTSQIASFSLGLTHFNSLISLFTNNLYFPFQPYKSGGNIQIIFKNSNNIYVNSFILSRFHIPFNSSSNPIHS